MLKGRWHRCSCRTSDAPDRYIPSPPASSHRTHHPRYHQPIPHQHTSNQHPETRPPPPPTNHHQPTHHQTHPPPPTHPAPPTHSPPLQPCTPSDPSTSTNLTTIHTTPLTPDLHRMISRCPEQLMHRPGRTCGREVASATRPKALCKPAVPSLQPSFWKYSRRHQETTSCHSDVKISPHCPTPPRRWWRC